MPLEIREIVIKAVVQEDKNKKEQSLNPQKIAHLKEEVLAYCLEKMEDKLNYKIER